MRLRIVLAAALLVAGCSGAPQTGSCQWYHYHDYTTVTTTCTSDDCTTHYVSHHDYVCDVYYPLPSDDHGDVPK